MRSLLLLVVLPLAVACASGTSGPTPDPDPSPNHDPNHDPNPTHVLEGKVVSPVTGLSVGVALSSAHLGAENCTHDESAQVKAASCAIAAPDAGGSLPRGTGACGGACDFSSLQLAFTPAATGASHVKITAVSLFDAATGLEVQKLSASTPLAWRGTQYGPWDETLGSPATLKASYTLAPPAWSKIDTTNSYSRQYRVRLVVEIDGAPITLESDALNRDPPVST